MEIEQRLQYEKIKLERLKIEGDIKARTEKAPEEEASIMPASRVFFSNVVGLNTYFRHFEFCMCWSFSIFRPQFSI